jgi:hypothetical protein
VVLTAVLLGLVIWEDYKLELPPLGFAIIGSFLESVSNMILRVGKTDQGRSNEPLLMPFILARTFPLALSFWVIWRFEDITASIHIVEAWPRFAFIGSVLPQILLLHFFQSGPNEVYRSPSGRLTSSLEDASPESREEVSTTLQAAFWTIIFGGFGKGEISDITWIQSFASAFIYLFGVGLVHTGKYLPTLLNFLAYLLRQKRHLKLKSWALFAFLLCSTTIWVVFMGGFMVYWTNTIVYGYKARSWIDNGEALRDIDFFPRDIRSFDIIIAHSAGHPVSSVLDLVDAVLPIERIKGQGPAIKVYTKDRELKKVKDDKVKGLKIIELDNVGGIAASYLHHIISKFDVLPVQTLFLSTTPKPDPNFHLYVKRIERYFEPQGFPLPAAVPKSGFLNLGEQEICDCRSCRDSYGWEDTFQLVPSMWSAAHSTNNTCDQVLLTYSNHFIVSADRIRGTRKDVWELLLDGLTNKDVGLAWTHDEARLPKIGKGEKRIGKWGEDGVYGKEDSLENPILGRTIERLWGVLFQCSAQKIVWRCPNLWRGWRRGWEMEDCGCIDEGLKGFN